ncbi:hypothetical protein P8452_15513 [Trifolium repens]|nr:hypothetical protein P8452_15513 [Trifolium repens]
MNPQNLSQIVKFARFQLIRNPNPQLLNKNLALLSKLHDHGDSFFNLCNKMLSDSSSHNHYTFTHALKACCSFHALSKGIEIHARIIKSGHISDLFIKNSLLHFYLSFNDVVSATRVFKSITFPDVVSWTSLISGLSKCGFESQAIDAFSSMNVKPNALTLVSAFSACSSIGALRFGKAIHAYGLKSLIDGNIVFDNAALDLYAKCRSLMNARNVFVKMSKRDVISWTTLLMAYARGGHCDEAVEVFKQMVASGEAEPNEATIVTVLSACASMGSLSLGCWVHSYVDERIDLDVDGNIGNALVNMYVKCGDMKMGLKVFNMVVNKDVISWGTVICGLAMNGYGKQAVQMCSRMLVHGVLPDDVTFIGLLSACSHVGLVSEGIMFFKAMRDSYGIMPQMRHYGCMVDMYGRAGLFEEAVAFLNGMPVEAEGPIWGALLQACKIHGNEEMSEWIREQICDKIVGVGTLALLSNIYASSERWDDANKVRKTMRGPGLKKVVGFSWVEPEVILESSLCVA